MARRRGGKPSKRVAFGGDPFSQKDTGAGGPPVGRGMFAKRGGKRKSRKARR